MKVSAYHAIRAAQSNWNRDNVNIYLRKTSTPFSLYRLASQLRAGNKTIEVMK